MRYIIPLSCSILYHIWEYLHKKKEFLYIGSMQEAKEVSVTLKDCEKRIKHDFLIYDELVIASDNKIIQECIAEAKKNFQGEPESIKVRVSLEVL